MIRLYDKVEGAEIFNIANENEGGIDELAKTIKELSGSSSEIKYIEAPKKRYDFEVGRRVGSSKKLEAAVGYKPHTKLIDGLKTIMDLT